MRDLHGIRVDSLHNLVSDALPDNGEWHTLTTYVRKVDGVLQVDELMLRREPAASARIADELMSGLLAKHVNRSEVVAAVERVLRAHAPPTE